VANANGSGNQPEKSGSFGKKNEKETGNRQDDSTTRFPDGTDSAIAKQGSETKMESMENARRSLRQGTFIREKNENEIKKENANLDQRPGEASQFDVADTTIIGSDEREFGHGKKESEQKRILGSKARGESGNVANANSDREKRNQSQDGERSRLEQDSSNMANTQGIYVQGQHDGQGQRQPWGESWWAVEPDVGRVAHGIPNRVDRLKALGNSLVPHVPYCIALSILEALDA
jgi:DNA (cytosine-5)-methyltransferase 1